MIRQAPRGVVWALTVATGIVMASARAAQAVPLCTSSTLDAYITQGSCVIDSLMFSDFELLGIPGGATPISADQITVNPLNDVSGIGLAFLFDAHANGDFLDVSFGYNVTGSISGVTLAMTGASATDDGSVTAIKNFCVDATFSFNCPALIVSAFDPALGLDDLIEATAFPATLLLGIIDDIGVDGTFGTAALSGSVTNRFAAGAIQPVPEPATLLLVGTGVAIVLRRHRVRRRARR